MDRLKPPAKGYESRIRTNALRLYRWTGAWVASLMLLNAFAIAMGIGVVAGIPFTVMSVALLYGNRRYR